MVSPGSAHLLRIYPFCFTVKIILKNSKTDSIYKKLQCIITTHRAKSKMNLVPNHPNQFPPPLSIYIIRRRTLNAPSSPPALSNPFSLASSAAGRHRLLLEPLRSVCTPDPWVLTSEPTAPVSGDKTHTRERGQTQCLFAMMEEAGATSRLYYASV